jgi:hypothetical protein
MQQCTMVNPALPGQTLSSQTVKMSRMNEVADWEPPDLFTVAKSRDERGLRIKVMIRGVEGL